MADGGISELAIASLVLTAVGTGTAVYAGMQQSAAQEDAISKSTKYNMEVDANNAKAAQDQAAYEAGLIRERGKRVSGAQAAAQGKSGASLDGSFTDVQLDSSFNNELDALAAEYQGKLNANRSMAQSGLTAMSGANAIATTRAGATASATSSILSGLGRGVSTGGDLIKTNSPPPSIRATQVPDFY